MVDPAVAEFWASWQDNNEGVGLEDVDITGADAAIAWGRARAEIVWIRLGHTHETYFSAGDKHPADDAPDEYVPHWPPQVPPGGWWQPPPRPTLDDVEAVAKKVRAREIDAEQASRWAEERLAMVSRYDEGVDMPTLRALGELRGDLGPEIFAASPTHDR